MIKERRLLVVLLVGAVIGMLAGCSSTSNEAARVMNSPVNIDTELDPNVDMSSYKTWDWLPNPNLDAVDKELQDPRVRGFIGDAVRNEMFAKGFEHVSNQRADLIMNFHIAVEKMSLDYVDSSIYNGENAPQYRTDIAHSGKGSKTFKKGSLILFLFDTKTGQMVWRAAAETEVTDEEVPMSQREARINQIVAQMFDKMPRKDR